MHGEYWGDGVDVLLYAKNLKSISREEAMLWMLEN